MENDLKCDRDKNPQPSSLRDVPPKSGKIVDDPPANTSMNAPHSNVTTLSPREVDMNKILCCLIQEVNAPEVKIDPLEGNPMEYQYFIAMFKEAVKTKVSNHRGRLTRLVQQQLKELVRQCVQENFSVGYQNALKILSMVNRTVFTLRMEGSFKIFHMSS